MSRVKGKGTVVLALLAAAALIVGGVAGPAASATGGDSVAEVAKKKGKKKKCKKGQVLKKGKCKKKKKKQQAQPIVRATITWQNADAADADLDLFVFAPDGTVSSPGVNGIAKSSISADVSGINGTESFTDLNFGARRAFSFGVCYQVGGSAHAPFTITYVTADGQSHTEDRDPGSSFHYDFPGGSPIPSGYCPD